jgi:hypothetical protein
MNLWQSISEENPACRYTCDYLRPGLQLVKPLPVSWRELMLAQVADDWLPERTQAVNGTDGTERRGVTGEAAAQVRQPQPASPFGKIVRLSQVSARPCKV